MGSLTQKTDTQPSVGSNKHSYKPSVYFGSSFELTNKCIKSGHGKTEKIHSHYVLHFDNFSFVHSTLVCVPNCCRHSQPPEDDQSVCLAYRFASSFSLLNRALNPALYCLRIDELREAVVNFVKIAAKRF